MPRIIGEEKKVVCKLDIHRSSSTREGDRVNITLTDEISGVQFFDGMMSLEEFALAVTGLDCRPIEAEIRGTEYIGKKYVFERRSVELPEQFQTSYYSKRGELEEWMEANLQEEGWLLSTYLGSQGSFTRNKEGKQLVNYTVSKYV